jgi:hypothetical protein
MKWDGKSGTVWDGGIQSIELVKTKSPIGRDLINAKSITYKTLSRPPFPKGSVSVPQYPPIDLGIASQVFGTGKQRRQIDRNRLT